MCKTRRGSNACGGPRAARGPASRAATAEKKVAPTSTPVRVIFGDNLPPYKILMFVLNNCDYMRRALGRGFARAMSGVANASLHGLWKVSSTPPNAAARELTAACPLPRRLRFHEQEPGVSGLIEAPYTQCVGRWALREGKAAGTQEAAIDVNCGEVEYEMRGLYDGERIAGSVSVGASGEGLEERLHVGDFLCTRLYSFWGEPKVAAGRPAGSETHDTR